MIDTCLRESAEHYINAIGGQALYSRDAFAASGITLSFLQSRPVEYRQFREPFVPGLSMIDVLMFNPIERVREHLTACDLI